MTCSWPINNGSLTQKMTQMWPELFIFCLYLKLFLTYQVATLYKPNNTCIITVSYFNDFFIIPTINSSNSSHPQLLFMYCIFHLQHKANYQQTFFQLYKSLEQNWITFITMMLTNALNLSLTPWTPFLKYKPDLVWFIWPGDLHDLEKKWQPIWPKYMNWYDLVPTLLGAAQLSSYSHWICISLQRLQALNGKT